MPAFHWPLGVDRLLPFPADARLVAASAIAKLLCGGSLNSVAGLAQSGHRQQRQNIKGAAFVFCIENDYVSSIGMERNKIPMRHAVFVSVRHFQYEREITLDCFLYLTTCHRVI